jgi:pterin-4a-carbinolamine dehydratase
VGALAEAMDHHPDVDIRYSKVTLALTTHDARAPPGTSRSPKRWRVKRSC